MGLLDDAIREHLELKRRHGADPGEVERQEQEVLGPTGHRADAEEAPGSEPAEAPYDASEDFAADAPTTVSPPAGDVEPPRTEESWLEEDEERPPRASDEAPAPGVDDVLEETPEFLQETPEHDRLWFEQKPPRDFDWDR